MEKRDILQGVIIDTIKKGNKIKQKYRDIYQGKYFDENLNREMLLRVITEIETSQATK